FPSIPLREAWRRWQWSWGSPAWDVLRRHYRARLFERKRGFHGAPARDDQNVPVFALDVVIAGKLAHRHVQHIAVSLAPPVEAVEEDMTLRARDDYLRGRWRAFRQPQFQAEEITPFRHGVMGHGEILRGRLGQLHCCLC